MRTALSNWIKYYYSQMSTVKKLPAKSRRAYRSPSRSRQAEATRERLISSARRLFAERGYAATSIDAIAGDANVATPTFYATFGSKPALLLALLDRMEVDADIPRLESELQVAATDPREQIRAFVDFGVRLYERATDVLEIVRAAGMSEKDLRSLWTEGEKRRRLAQRALVRRWSKEGSLKPGLGVDRASDIFWALTGPDSFRLFQRECGWRAGYYAQWLAETLAALLLRDP